MGTIILVIVILFIVIAIATAKHSEIVGNWSYLFPDMQHDPVEFYKKVEEIIEERKIPNILINTKTIKEGGVFSYQRVYMEVIRGDYIFHICAAPWGNGFFFSWWQRVKLNEFDAFIQRVPIIGPPIYKARQHKSYYKLDTDAMFRASVQKSVLAAIDQLTKAKGIRELTELERKPDLRAIIK